MKNRILLAGVIFISIIMFTGTGKDNDRGIKVMTFNIRYDNPNDGENGWLNRRESLLRLIKLYKADIIGTQEVLKNQLDYIAGNLEGFGWTGIGRDDGKQAGEYSVIFFNRKKVEMLESDTFWCSETPGKPGLGWDAVCNRIVTWGKFRVKESGIEFYVFNTHFDHIGVTARLKSAELIMEKIKSICSGEPVIITGDFNSTPSDKPYEIITALYRQKIKYDFYDSKNISESPHKGLEGTFNGFKLAEPATGPIDYIFVSNGINVKTHENISDKFNDH